MHGICPLRGCFGIPPENCPALLKQPAFDTTLGSSDRRHAPRSVVGKSDMNVVGVSELPYRLTGCHLPNVTLLTGHRHGHTNLLFQSRIHRDGHREQGLSPSYNSRSAEHHPRRQDHHFQRCNYPRRPQKDRSRTCGGYILGKVLSSGGRVCHETTL